MTNQTLRLPRTAEKAEAPVVRMPTAEEVALYMATQRAAAAPAVDWKYDAPVVSSPVNLSALPPAGSRNSDPVQVPARVWGDPTLLKPSAPAGPQPLFTPPRGK